MPAFIDSRFPRDATATMQRAVADAQERRRTIMGPPAPAAPIDMSEGVEVKGRRLLTDQLNQGPPSPTMQNMVVNGGRPYAPRLPGTDIGGPPDATAPVQAPPALPGASAPRLAPRMPGTEIGEPRNPLGGMPTTPLSSRGGPMNYSQQGVGTNNPNAYAVGRGRRDVGTRILERLARRGNAAAAGQLAGQAFQSQQTEGDRGFTVARDRVRRADEMTDYRVRRGDEVADRDSERTWQGQREDAQNRRRDDEYRIRRADELQDYGRTRADEIADRDAESIVGDATLPVQGGSVPAVRTKGGGVKMAGGFMPTPKEAPDLSKYGNDPNLRIKSVDSTGKATWERVDDGPGKLPKIYQGAVNSLTNEKARDYYYEPHPDTGKPRKVYIDEDGDGKVSPEEAAKAAAEAPKVPVKKAAGSNSFLGKVK